jgi:hypothetical protein
MMLASQVVGVIADLAVRVTSEPVHGRDVVDVLTLIFAGLATPGTFGAILVALFGPGWRAIRSQPLLAVTAESTSTTLDPNDPRSKVSFVEVLVKSERGKRQADDVEVFVTIVAPLRIGDDDDVSGGMTVVNQEQLAYSAYPSTSTRASVPAGFNRRIGLLVAGTRADVEERYHPTFNPAPAHDWMISVAAASRLAAGQFPKLFPGGPFETYYVLFEVVASNIDATRYVGRFKVEIDRHGAWTFRWLERPSAADETLSDADDFTEWLTAHGKASGSMRLHSVEEDQRKEDR